MATDADVRRPPAWALAAALTGAGLGAWCFAFLCDDAYISFRYARNLAHGLGFVFNPGDAPVEGFTNLLWVLWLAPFEALGLGAPLGAQLGSLLAGALLLVAVARHLWARTSAALAPLAGLAFLASAPPLWVWSSGGLETMAFAAAAFAVYDRALCGPPRALGASAALLALVGLRADGFVWAGLVLGALGLDAWRRGDAPLLRRVLRLALLALLASAALFAWRWATFGALVPNTARVKLAFGALSLERGALYVLGFLASVASVPLALALALAPAAGARRERAPLTIVLGGLAYAVAVGGDFMAMGRFLVPGLAFLAVALALALDGARSRALRVVAPPALVVLGLLAAFDLGPLPRALRARLDFRWSNEAYESEVERWASARRSALRWAAQGRELARLAQPGDSLVIGTIGAVGYHSDLVILDPFGLVNREPLSETGELGRRSAGHERRVPLEVFLARAPTFLESRFVPADDPEHKLKPELAPGGRFAAHARLETHAVAPAPGVPEGWVLRVVRHVP